MDLQNIEMAVKIVYKEVFMEKIRKYAIMHV